MRAVWSILNIVFALMIESTVNVFKLMSRSSTLILSSFLDYVMIWTLVVCYIYLYN